MERNGFHRVTDPQPGDVVVIQSWVFGVTGGHIAFVNSTATYSPNGTISFDMVGANQDYPPYSVDTRTEQGCNNVTTIGHQSFSSSKREGLSFWRR